MLNNNTTASAGPHACKQPSVNGHSFKFPILKLTEDEAEQWQSSKKRSPPDFKVDDFANGPVNDTDQSQESDPGQESYKDKFLKSILDQTKDYPLPEPVISIVQNGETISFLTLKSFSLWQGKQKSKKTTALALAVVAFLLSVPPTSDGVRFITSQEGGVVLVFDTEQGQSYAARTMKLILKLVGVDFSPKLIYSDLREYSPNERMGIIKAGIEYTPNVKLVVIDGLVDLLTDFMDAAEGHFVITELLKYCSTYNIHIAGVLHQNKNDKNARAHIGAIASQKCEIEISTEIDSNDKTQSIVSCANSRGIPFEPFAIRWDKGSLPCIVQEWSASKDVEQKDKRRFEIAKEIVESIFKGQTALTPTETERKIMQTLNVSESTAKRRIKDYTGWDLITQNGDGRYRLNIEKGSRVQMGSKEGS